MNGMKFGKAYASYMNNLRAAYKQAYRASTGCDDQELQLHLAKFPIDGPKIKHDELEDRLYDLVRSGVGVDWKKGILEPICEANGNRVSLSDMDEIYDAMRERAAEEASSLDYDQLSTGICKYLSDEEINGIYDRSID